MQYLVKLPKVTFISKSSWLTGRLFQTSATGKCILLFVEIEAKLVISISSSIEQVACNMQL